MLVRFDTVGGKEEADLEQLVVAWLRFELSAMLRRGIEGCGRHGD